MDGRADLERPLEWPKNRQPDEYYIIEEGMYELIFGSQQPKEKTFRNYCCNTMFPRIRQQLTDKMEENRRQAIIGIQKEHQLAL